MADKIDQAKGGAKEAAGKVTGNRKQQAEGKVQREGAKAKEKAGKAVDKAKARTR